MLLDKGKQDRQPQRAWLPVVAEASAFRADGLIWFY
jgi:hypothetical protein